MVHGRACSPNPARESRGRLIRFWGKVLIRGEPRHRFLRVITLDDGKTIHNACLIGISRRKSDEATLLSRNRQPIHRIEEHTRHGDAGESFKALTSTSTGGATR